MDHVHSGKYVHGKMQLCQRMDFSHNVSGHRQTAIEKVMRLKVREQVIPSLGVRNDFLDLIDIVMSTELLHILMS